MKKLIVAFVCSLGVYTCQAEIIYVPAQFNNIQEAIDNSWHGDTVIVSPDTYNESISFKGRAITLTSEYPNDPNVVQLTIITASSDYSVTFEIGEGSDSVLTGFTITGRGIYCKDTSPTISKNIIRDCGNVGIEGGNDAAPTISDNTISRNNDGGIAWCDGLISGNIIISNRTISSAGTTKRDYGGGLYYCNGQIVGNVVANNYAKVMGGGIYGGSSNISNNIIVGNKTIGSSGGGLCNCQGPIHHNIIAGNRSSNDGGGLYGCRNDIYNNTIVGNIAVGNGGALFNCTGSVRNNIIVFNQAGFIGGIYGVCNNSYNTFWYNNIDEHLGGGAMWGPGDIIVQPSFAIDGYWSDPCNTPGDSTDDVWVNGDYHLKSEVGRWDPNGPFWVIDSKSSQCMDIGDPNSDWTAELWPHGKGINTGAYGGTAQASMSLKLEGNIANLNNDPCDWVDYNDMMLLTDKWLCEVNEAPLAEEPNGNREYRRMLEYLRRIPLAEDLDRGGLVNFIDFAIFVNNWRPQPLPPIPDPMTWATPPYAASSYSIAMVATTATSTDGSGVQYYFKCTFGGGHDSGWQDEPNYIDTGLSADTEYRYKVQARNKADEMETDWSDERSATTLPEDATPPEPDPAEWETEPYATSSTSIRMEAKVASDPSGVEYKFECLSHPAYSSNWQDDDPVYEVTNLPEGTFSFVVRVRDKSPNHNTTGDSTPVVTVDLQPPTPDPMIWDPNLDPYGYDGKPRKVGSPPFNYWATMRAAKATDENGVEYKFVCTNDSNFSSGGLVDREHGDGVEWRNEDNVPGDPRTYEVKLGGPGVYTEWVVIARDRSPSQNETNSSWPPWPAY